MTRKSHGGPDDPLADGFLPPGPGAPLRSALTLSGADGRDEGVSPPGAGIRYAPHASQRESPEGRDSPQRGHVNLSVAEGVTLRSLP